MKYSLKQILSFYLENGLDEILANEPQSHFKTLTSSTKISSQPSSNHHSQSFSPEKSQTFYQTQPRKIREIVDLKIKNGSTDNALAALAKKQQNNKNSEQFAESENKTSTASSIASLDTEDETSVKKFLSIAEIIAMAKKSADSAKNLEELSKAVSDFEGCNLKKMATNTVFCDGNPQSKIMLIGEAPGNNEDLQGIPFCGDSGEMLSQMLAAINLHRQSDYYITNVLFWRPPGNRRPTDEELAICRPFVERHIQLVDPKIIILIGATAMSAVLGINEPISKIRGQFQKFAPAFLPKPITSLTIFHPSFLMRQPAKKKLAWLDMLNLEQFLKN